MPHGGGVRIPTGPAGICHAARLDRRRACRLARRAIRTVAKIEVAPRERQLAHGQAQQQLEVTATWSDGRQEDVTRLARFQSNNEGLAAVDEDGLVTAGQTPGDVAVMASYMGAVDVFHGDDPAAAKPSSRIRRSPNTTSSIGHVYRRLQASSTSLPSEVCSDAEYLRRVYLDLIGTLPTADEARTLPGRHATRSAGAAGR